MTFSLAEAEQMLERGVLFTTRLSPTEEVELRLDRLELRDGALVATISMTQSDIRAPGERAIRDIKEQACLLVPAEHMQDARVAGYLAAWRTSVATFRIDEAESMMPDDFTLVEALDDRALSSREDFTQLFRSSERVMKIRAAGNEAALAEVMPALRDQLRRQVRAGWIDDESIVSSAHDLLMDRAPSVDHAGTIALALEATKAELREEQSSWPAVTDCDRLVRAFDALEAVGIVARHDFSCCQRCGHTEMNREIADRKVRGYTFYHRQDTESVIDTGTLFLAFGCPSHEDSASLDVARTIERALKDSGLRVFWDGTTSKRIGVELDWKLRREACLARVAQR